MMIDTVNERLGTPKAPPYSPLLSFMEEHLAKQLVRYAVGEAIFCPRCNASLDAPEAVIVTDDQHNTQILCAACWGKPVGHIKAGSVTVYDGRALWRPKSKNVWRWA
jgi:hypothetical protein